MSNETGETSDLLYHVMRTIVDFHKDESGATQIADILGTFTDLAAAKAAARSGLASEGYIKDDFEIYEENDGKSSWTHGDGVLSYAKAPAGQVFEVRVDTSPNSLKFKGNADGEVEGHLHYVIQQTIRYDKDPIGSAQEWEVEGTYPTRAAARTAARTALLDEEVTKDSYAEYDEFDDERDINEWPFGEEVLVHAVAETGENFNIFVKAQPHSHQHHSCKHHGGEVCQCPCKHTDKDCKAKGCKHGDACDCK